MKWPSLTTSAIATTTTRYKNKMKKTIVKAGLFVGAFITGVAAPYGAVILYLCSITWYNQIVH